MRNCGELLALYVRQGLLGEATQLAHQYIDAVMGHATQQVRVAFQVTVLWEIYTQTLLKE